MTNHTTLLSAVLSNDIEAVKRLLDPNVSNSNELENAVINQYHEVVQLLLPVSSADHNMLLRFATVNRDERMIELLFDVSEPLIVLDSLKSKYSEEVCDVLARHIQMRTAQQENEVLHQSIHSSHSSKSVRKI